MLGKTPGRGARRRRTLQASIEALEPRLVLDSTVVFNEIMYNPAQSDESLEWVELHNQNSVDVDISAWRIDDGINFDFPEGTIVPGGGYLVVAKDPAALAAAGIIGTALGPYGGQLSNGGEQLDLRDRTDRLMDRLDYNDSGRWPVAPDGSGASLAKIDPNLASGESESWSTSFVVGGTPGVENGLEKLGGPGDPPEPDIVNSLTTLSDPWRFEASGAAQPADWRELDFDDSAWGGAGGDADLVGYWDFEGNANDRSGNGNDGVLKNGAALNADTPGGFSTQALRLSGTQYVLVPHDDSLNIATSMTIAAWVKPVGNVFWDGIIAKNPSAGSAANHAGNYELRINSSNRQLQFLWEQGGANTTTSASAGTSPIANNQWTHIAVTVVKGGSAEFYVNGSLIATRGVNASFGVTNTNALYIGDRADITSTPFDGLLDDVALWNGALEADAIAALAAKTASPLDFGANRGPYFAGSAPSPPGEGELPLGPTTYYFRQEFDFDEDSARTELVLNTLVDDGAIFYLNGDELHRQNMPAGAVSFGTLASSTVGIASESGDIVVPASSLRAGRNVLAVEVHQASAADGDMLFAAELTAITSPIQSVSFQPISLAINETAAAGAGDNDFWFELFNHGDETVDLDGFVVKSTAGDAHTLSGISIAPGTFVVLTEAQIGFDVLPDTRIFLYNEDESQVVSAAVVKISATARHPDGTGRFLLPATATPGQPNALALRDEIVINEIFYHAPEVLDESNPEEWLELYNRSAETVDLAGWSLDGAVDFLFPLGTTLAPQQYLVVARDAAALRVKYPAINVVGQYDGRLNNSTDRIVLEDPSGNPADVVEYYQDGRWSRDADGGGSSLELRDPAADNAVAEAWAASDESGKTAWRRYSYEGIVQRTASIRVEDNVDGLDRQWNELVLGMLSRGEVLLDNISVIRDPQGAASEQVINGGFESDALGTVPSSWRMIGTHRHSEIIVDPADPNNRVLRFVATDPTEHMHNQANTTLRRSISNNVRYRISFDARWVSGSNQLNSRLYFNRLPATTLIDRPNQWGTPGEANSVLESNIGPTFESFIHAPAVPEPNEPVTVLATVSDPSGVASMTLRYAINGGAFQSTTMRHSGGGNYQGTIPPQAAGTIVQFYAEATDGEGARATFPRSGADSRALYKVNDGLAATTGLHNLRFIMTPADANFMHATVNLMSNDRIGLTVIYDESEIFYDVGIRLSGSERARPFTVRLSFNVRFNTEHLFRGVQRTIALDRSESTGFGQQEALTHLVTTHVGMIPSEYNDLIHIITPRSAHTGGAELQMSRFTDTFLSTQFANGDDGMLFEYELIYFPTTADAQGNKRPQPDGTRGTSLRSLGSDKENYRQNYLIKNNRSRDDYSRLIEFLQVMALGGSAFNNQIADVIDVDQWLRAFALTTISGAGDNFGSGAQHNAQFYVRPEDGRVLFFPHDLDAFLSPTLALAPGSVLPKLIADRTRAHMYYGHVYDMLTTTYNQQYMRHFTENYGSLLPGQNFAGHLAFINQRSNFLLGQINNVARPTDFAIITGSPLNVGNAPSATVTGNGWIDVREIRLAGSDAPLQVTWSSSTRWVLELPVAFGRNDLTFEAYDFQGNLIASDSITVNSTATDLRIQDALRISEIHYNPADPPLPDMTGDGQFEFIELVNVGAETLDLDGVRFASGIGFDFGTSNVTSLSAGDYVVVVRNEAAFLSRYDGFDASLIAGEFSGKLDNGGERLTLVDRFGVPIHEFSYRDGWHKLTDGDGFSLSIIDAAADVETWGSGDAWRPSSLVHGSPGADDPRLLPDPGQLVINELLSHTDRAGGDWVELHNTTGAAIDVGGWFLSDDAAMLQKYRIAPGTTVPAGGFLVFGEQTHFGSATDPAALVPFAFSELGDDVILQAADPMSGALQGFFSRRIFGAAPRDVTFGNYLKSDGGDDFTAMISPTRGTTNTAPRVGPIVIEEIMYNPGSVGDNSAGEEFIELKNISGAPVPLFDPARPTNTWAFTSGIGFEFPAGVTLPAGGLALVVPSDPDTYRAAHRVPVDVPIFGPYLSSLNNAGEKIELSRPGEPNPDGVVPMIAVERVTYDDKAPWPTQADGDGWSLQRKASDEYGNDPINWSVTIPGGTPGSFVVAPQVAEVFVSGSGWSAAALDELDGAGFSIRSGAVQLQTIGWTGIDRLSIRFSEPVDVSQDDLRLFGTNVSTYNVVGFSYDDASRTATWTLSDSIAADKLRLELSDAVTDVSGLPLDGNWTDAVSSFPSGNGAIDTGGDDIFRFRFNVLPGDGLPDADVARSDLFALIGALGSNTNQSRYNARLDVDLDGAVDIDDLRAMLLRHGNHLPGGNPHQLGAPLPRPAIDEVFERLGAAAQATIARPRPPGRARRAPSSSPAASAHRPLQRHQAVAVDRALDDQANDDEFIRLTANRRRLRF